MSNILAIETSFPAASTALQLGDTKPVSRTFESHRQQNQLLFLPLEELLANLPDSETIDLIIVGTGPGSYSGTRISIAAAQGIAAIYGCAVVGLSSFLGTGDKLKDSIAVGDARRGSYFIAHIPQNELPKEPELMDRETFDSKIQQSDAQVFSLDNHMLFSNGSTIPKKHSTAEGLIRAWNELTEAQQQKLLSTPPSPTYLRAPFITKAKPGHPLLRGKVNENKG